VPSAVEKLTVTGSVLGALSETVNTNCVCPACPSACWASATVSVGAASSLTIVPMPVPSETATVPSSVVTVTVNVSLASKTVSPMTGTTNVAVVSPARMIAVPVETT
jgi:hypothetical protein